MPRLYFLCPVTKKNISTTFNDYSDSGGAKKFKIMCRHCDDVHTYSRSDIKRIVAEKIAKKLSR